MAARDDREPVSRVGSVAWMPDACTAANPSVEQRQAAVRAKWGRAGRDDRYFVALAANLGFTITITEFTPSRRQPCDEALCEPEWSYVAGKRAQVVTFYFAVDESGVMIRWNLRRRRARVPRQGRRSGRDHRVFTFS